jgi:rod shape-determining protein MreC
VDFLYRWRRPLVAVLAVMVLAVLLSYTARLRHSVLTLGGLVYTVTAPVSDVLSQAGAAVASGVGVVTHLFTLEQENQRLQSQLRLMQSLRLELAEVLADNAELRSLLYVKQQLGPRWRFVVAAVIARNPDTWFDTVTLNAGSLSGIRPGMPVIVPQGVVGRIVSVTPDTAQVLLVTDPESGVGAEDVRSLAAGVVQGTSSANGLLQFQLFTHRPDVEPGDAVVTSGYSEYFPKGLLLGQVVQVAPSQYGLTETATVAPAVDFNRLDLVLVVVSHPRGGSVPPLTIAGGSP